MVWTIQWKFNKCRLQIVLSWSYPIHQTYGKGDTNSYCNHSKEVLHLKSYICGEFEVKDLGSLCYFLEIEVARSKRGIFISKRKHILDLLTETRLLWARPAETPIEANHGLNDQDGKPLIDARRCQKLVGKLTYLALTRHGIAFAVGVVSQFMRA